MAATPRLPPSARLIRRRRLVRVGALAVATYVILDSTLLPMNFQVSRQAALASIGAYQVHVSPLIRNRVVCRFDPSCSEYARRCYSEMPFLEATRATIARLHRCS